MLKKLLLLAVAAFAIAALAVPATAPASQWAGEAEIEEEIVDFSKEPGQFQITGSLNEDFLSGESGIGAGPCQWTLTGLLWNENYEEEEVARGSASYSQTPGCAVHGAWPNCLVTSVQAKGPVPISTVGNTIEIGTIVNPIEILRKTNGCGNYAWASEPNVRGALSGSFDNETGALSFDEAPGMEWFGSPYGTAYQMDMLMSGEMTVWPKGLELK
jgi:hypothetical protein